MAFTRLPAAAARMLAVETLLAEPEELGDDVLESCLYLLREKLRAAQSTGLPVCFRQHASASVTGTAVFLT